MRPRREPEPGRRSITRRRTITPQHEPVRRQQRRVEIDRHPAHVERDAEGVVVGEVGRDDETGRLRVEQGEVGVPDGCGRLVGDLGAAVGAADAGGGEGDVLLEPDEVGRDRGAEICGCVDEDGDVGCVEGEAAAEGGDFGGDWKVWVSGDVGLEGGFLGGGGLCEPL